MINKSEFRFIIVEKSRTPPQKPAKNVCYLIRDNWDDFGFKTSFDLHYVDFAGSVREIGPVAIGRQGMIEGYVQLPSEFVHLSNLYFSELPQFM